MQKLLATALALALAGGCGSGPVAGPQDAGSAADGGSSVDGGVSADGGSSVDGGVPADGGMTSDGGVPTDGGTSHDGGVPTDGGNACVNDQDCPDGFCGLAQDGGMVCKPWSEEGEGCGGFVVPWMVRRCRPDLSCLTAEPNAADLPGICTHLVTVATLLATPETYRDHHVGISSAWLNTGAAPDCLQVLNDQDTPTPSGGLGLRTNGGQVYACSGAQCQMSCTAQDGHYRALGYFRRTAGGDYLEVSSLRRYLQ